jgi:hypothetical protein
MVIVLRPGPVADPVQDPTGFDRVTGSAGLVLFLKKLKRRRFSKNKKQKSTGLQPGCRANPPGHTEFFLPPFFLQPGPVPAPGRAGFQNYKYGTSFLTKI